MPYIEDSSRRGDFIISLANRTRSLDNEILAAGNKIAAGEVLARLSSGGKLVPFDGTAATGAEVAIGVSLAAYDATDADVAIVVVARDAELKSEGLVWPDGVLTADRDDAIAALAANGIVLAPR